MIKEYKLGKIIDIFGGSSYLTKNNIYYMKPKHIEDSIPVYSGSIDIKNKHGFIDKNLKLKMYSGPAILICRKGQAGKMSLVNDNLFAVNDDAYVIYIKPEYQNEIDLKWFSYKFQKLFYNISTGKQGCGTFSKNYALNQFVEIPDIEVQLKQSQVYEELYKVQEVIDLVYIKINNFLGRVHFSENMEEYKISDVFYLDTGKRITKNDLYSNLNYFVGRKDLIPIVSSGTKNNGVFGYASEEWINSNHSRKTVIKDKDWDPWYNYKGASRIVEEPCITWNTDGDAGDLFYREDKFFPTDHCGVLIPKDEFRDKINLKYFVYTQKYKFKQSTDRGNLHKKQMANEKFEIPDINTQNKIVEYIEGLLNIKEKIDVISNKLSSLKEINIE